MPTPNPLSPLLTALAGLYAGENRPGGASAAHALLDAASEKIRLPERPPGPLNGDLMTSLAGEQHPLSSLIQQAAPWLHWIYSEMGGRIRSDIANGMMQSELVGPDGIFPHSATRVGLWVQSSDLDYTTRTHAAEETFFILGGHAIWRKGNDTPLEKNSGARVHHPSMTPHSNCTTNAPLLAAWRWSGDISIEQYTLTG